MRELKFIVKQQRIRKDPDCDFSNLVAGSKGYLKAAFRFSPDWSGCKKAASFWFGEEEHATLLDELGCCMIPEAAITGELFEVSVTGIKPDGYTIKSGKTKVRQEVC